MLSMVTHRGLEVQYRFHACFNVVETGWSVLPRISP